MKTIILVRHAESNKDIDGIKDWERPVSAKGISDSHKIVNVFRVNNPTPDRIITSHAFRALNTAIIMAEALNYKIAEMEIDRRLYNTTGENIMEMLRERHNEHSSLMLVGHNPSISDLYLLLTKREGVQLQLSSVSVLQFDANNWREICASSISEIHTYSV